MTERRLHRLRIIVLVFAALFCNTLGGCIVLDDLTVYNGYDFPVTVFCKKSARETSGVGVVAPHSAVTFRGEAGRRGEQVSHLVFCGQGRVLSEAGQLAQDHLREGQHKWTVLLNTSEVPHSVQSENYPTNLDSAVGSSFLCSVAGALCAYGVMLWTLRGAARQANGWRPAFVGFVVVAVVADAGRRAPSFWASAFAFGAVIVAVYVALRVHERHEQKTG